MSALAEALVAAQAELPCAIGKDADGQIGQRNYRYLTLDKLIAETRPILQAHGLAIVQSPSLVERGDQGVVPTLATTLLHTSGEKVEFATPLYLTEKTMQGLGSAITYARRYAWQSVLGIAAEEDTDAKDDIPF
jgi:ERF superfamily.